MSKSFRSFLFLKRSRYSFVIAKMMLVRVLQASLKKIPISEYKTPLCLREEANSRCYRASFVDVPPLRRLAPNVSSIFWSGLHLLERPGSFSSSSATCRRISDVAGNRQANEPTAESRDENSSLAAQMKAEIPPAPSSLGYIFRVPERLRVTGEDTYDPRILSIGPYHHGSKECFKATENYKKWYLDSFISRTEIPMTTLIKAIRKMEVDARLCYAEPLNLTSDEFVRMMVHDGCFILELFYRFEKKYMESTDTIFGSTWLVPSLRRDLLLLENQIPYIVLDCLFNLTNTSTQESQSLPTLVMNFFSPILPTTTRNIRTNSITKSNHLLDLLRNHIIRPSREKTYADYPYCEYTRGATELWHAGVKLRKKEVCDGLLDITFTKNGVLEIPCFQFGVSWTILLPNLVALEQCRQDCADHVTSYVILLDCLVNSRSDVKLLRDAGVIDKLFKEDEHVALAINSLYKRVVGYQFYYDQLCKDMNQYSSRTWPRWRASLTSEYFNTPWSIVKVVTAAILLVLSTFQTFPTLKGSTLSFLYPIFHPILVFLKSLS